MHQQTTSFIVGLTGGMGSGKTCAAEFLREHGAVILDADQLAREAVAPGSPSLIQIQKVFGQSMILPSGMLNRKALADVVFSNAEQRKKLESILHPEIRRLFEVRISELIQASHPPQLIVCVIPLLFESGYPYNWLRCRSTVSAPLEQRLERVVRRDHCSREAALARINAQLPQTARDGLADYIIHNEGSLEDLKARTAEFYRWLCPQLSMT